MEKKNIRWIIGVVLILSTLFDIITFSLHKKMQIFESNPIFNIMGSNFAILLKIILTIVILYYYINSKSENYSKANQFSWTCIILLLTIAQGVGGLTNLTAINNIKIQTNSSNIEDIPIETLKSLQPSNSFKTSYYISFAGFIIYWPLLFSILSFKIWQLGFEDKKIYK